MTKLVNVRIERERADKLERLRSSLTRQAAPFLRAGGGVLVDADRCTIAAHEAAQIGDMDEAELQLRFRDHPKWSDKSQCLAAYKRAMAIKRGASA